MSKLERKARAHAAETARLRDLAYEAGDVALALTYAAALDAIRAEWLAIKDEEQAREAFARKCARDLLANIERNGVDA